ncbi:hypothetical protein B1R32_13123 [Abditibacterium utsteinense]|uniref:Hpr(Ser) kinase/phosphatase n=1 Tax=Abditibacterium utsteinense TaxID=1960156 RepID=A0A2S8SNZ5_9BACT|nr:hypothetical protein [Abditibacterium utsteinense]PQV62510.1 hypothetical protein B1R32_13123 [Abditibacterium utsteinense]
MRYRIFDFDIQSEIALPCEISQDTKPIGEPARWALEITFHATPEWVFDRATPIGRRFWGCAYDVGDGILISTQSGVLLHFCADGSRIKASFDRQNPFQSAQVGAWIVNLGMAICHSLRGGISLHGASVEWHGHLFALMASSGTGKSTLLWRLLDGGALFCADDMLPVYADKAVTAVPCHSLHGKLSGAALQSRGLSPACFQEIVPGADEFWVPIPASRRTLDLRRPSALFILSPFVAADAEPTTAPIFARRHSGADAVSFLMANTHALWATCELLDSKSLIQKYLQLANQVPIFSLHYARDFAVLAHVREALGEILTGSNAAI